VRSFEIVNELIRKLVEAWGPSGYEHQVRALIRAEVEGLADEVTQDALGNLICRIGVSGGKKVMVAAHMDEIGVMATFREPQSGYLRFAPLGYLLHTGLVGSRVRFEDGTVGVIGVHDSFGAKRTEVPELDDFFIDVSTGNGVSTVREGSPAAFWREFEVRGSRLIGKSMDDRIGCVVAIEALRRLKGNTPHDVYFVFTVQEEVGLRGARPAAYHIEPDVAIALDVTHSGDQPKNAKMAVRLGEGTAIKIGDSGLVVPPAVRDWMLERAAADGIPHQLEVLQAGTTDAAGIQIARAGVPSGVISIPCRFVHTPSETVDAADVEASIALLTALLRHDIPAL
jgi:endoglucanase